MSERPSWAVFYDVDREKDGDPIWEFQFSNYSPPLLRKGDLVEIFVHILDWGEEDETELIERKGMFAVAEEPKVAFHATSLAAGYPAKHEVSVTYFVKEVTSESI